MREDVPDRRPSPFGLRRAFNLVCSRRNAPEEPRGEFPALILGRKRRLVAGWERRVVQGRRRHQFACRDWCRLHSGVDGCCLDGADEEVPVFCY